MATTVKERTGNEAYYAHHPANYIFSLYISVDVFYGGRVIHSEREERQKHESNSVCWNF
jgi:hypothetical protein